MSWKNVNTDVSSQSALDSFLIFVASYTEKWQVPWRRQLVFISIQKFSSVADTSDGVNHW